MFFYHATPKRNLDSIMMHGICTHYAQGKRPLTWIHSITKREWSIIHTMQRHNIKIEDLTILMIDIPRSWTTRTKWKGIYTVSRHIPIDRISYVDSTQEILREFGFIGYTKQDGHQVY